MAPPQVIITQPQTDNSNNNSLLSSFITSKMLNETMNLNRTNMTNVEPSRIEQPSYFNARESIIPNLPDTPLKQEVKPPPTVKGPPPPPPPPKTGDKKEPPKGLNLTGLTGRDAMLAELKYAQSEEGKAEKERKKAETAAKKEAKKMEKEVKQQSTTDFLNMSFTPPKRDIVEMMTPNKDAKSTAIIPYRENKSLLDFAIGGTPAKIKTQQDIKEEKMKARLSELKKKKKLNTQESFELNDLKSNFTLQPNPNKEIATSIIGEAIKRKAAAQTVKNIKEKPIKTIQAIYRGNKVRNVLANDKTFQNKIDMKIKKYSDAASDYKTRGADTQDINKEFSDVMKTMRTGLQKYKTTLGKEPKKRGPKPKNPYSGLKKTEL